MRIARLSTAQRTMARRRGHNNRVGQLQAPALALLVAALSLTACRALWVFALRHDTSASS